MRDYQEVIIKFVKIVEKYPELYNPSHDSYRTRRAELAWDKIAESVRSELKEQCTVEEIKTKWKGIRSSFIRFKNKLQKSSDTTPCKKYYLYDSLKFLEPFSKARSNAREGRSTYEESGNSDDDDSTREEFAPDMDRWDVKVKTEVEDESDNVVEPKQEIDGDSEEMSSSNNTGAETTDTPCDNTKKRKCDECNDANYNEDLHFFRSILTDIKDFSMKEKRKLKMGILKLIDVIEEGRAIYPAHEVSSTKIKRQSH